MPGRALFTAAKGTSHTSERDRNLAGFRALTGAAGLEVQTAERQPSVRFVVECRPTT
jgi:hypothetical protein